MRPIARPLRWPVVAVVLGLAIVCGSQAAEPEQGKGPPGEATPAKTAPGGIIISRETTFLTGPLRKDGSVDYLAALNERCSKGVTPENNAAIPLLQAVGTAGIIEATRPQYFKMLGIAPMPDKGLYLEPYVAYVERTAPGSARDARERSEKEKLRIIERPWSKSDLPLAAAWLEENRKQIDLVATATKRARWYSPLVATRDEPGNVIDASLPLATPAREAARALCARAMFRVAAGKPEDAWQDLVACHRLARLVDQGPTMVEGLVGIAIEGMAVQGDAALAHEGKLTADQARRFAAEFRNLPPLTKMADRIDWAERLLYLDCVSLVACKGIGYSPWLPNDSKKPEGLLASLAKRLLTAMIDWNEPMRMGNRWYDRLAAVASKPTGKDRAAALVDCDRDSMKARADFMDFRALLRNIAAAGSLRRGLGRHAANVFVSLLTPALFACATAEDRNTVTRGFVPIAFALAAYRAEQGAYPADLTSLAPKYIAAVPTDPFAEGPPHYKRVGEGYILYSVGRNGKDDGGLAEWDGRADPNAGGCDDIAIRVPAEEKP